VSFKYKLNDGVTLTETAVGTPINLSGLGEGTHTVSVIGKDSIGNWQAESDATTSTWTVDTTPPAGTMLINNGDTYTTSANVSLDLSITDAEDMCFSNDNLTYTDWEAYASSKNWNLPAGDGLKTVYVKVRDALGNSAVISDSITFDATAPSGTVVIDDNAEYTTSQTVTLTLDASVPIPCASAMTI
jgi:hypothetical protein